jgi:predicted cupin superfamily sugar epimerase
LNSSRRSAWTCGALLILAWLPASADNGPDGFVARLEALALIQTLNAELLSHDSATSTLEHWCDLHRLASPARIVATRVRDVDKTPTAEQRRELAVAPTELLRYRRVKLMCGEKVLSEADNWYVPGRLTSAMNEQLDTTDIPFGRVVQALHFQRRTLSSTVLWLPLPEAWEMSPAPQDMARPVLNAPRELLQHRALLTLPDGTPFSEVVETYTAEILDFPRAAPGAPTPTAAALIAHYDMQPVPQEGIWFARTYLSEDHVAGAALPLRYAGREHAAGNAIVAIATHRDFSALHRLLSDETWHFYSGAPLEMLLLYPDGRGRKLTLGADVLAGEVRQVTVPHGVWQGATPRGDAPDSYSFFGTQLSPGFEYADFEPGDRYELRHRYPDFAAEIARLTRK